jgi:hypothetical protein
VNALASQLEIECQLQPQVDNWYFPVIPSILFFLSLKAFLNSCDRDKGNPKISLYQHAVQCETGRRAKCVMDICFASGCNLRARYYEKLHGKNGLGGTSEYFDKLRLCHVDVKHEANHMEWTKFLKRSHNLRLEQCWKGDQEVEITLFPAVYDRS